MAAALARANNAQLQYTTFGDDEDDGFTPGGVLVGDSLVLDDDDSVFYSPQPPTTPGGSALAAATAAARGNNNNAGDDDWRLTGAIDEMNLGDTPPRATDGYPSSEALAQAAAIAEAAHNSVALGTRPWNPKLRSQQVGNIGSPVHRSRTDSTSSVMSTDGPPPGWGNRGRRTSWIDESFAPDEDGIPVADEDELPAIERSIVTVAPDLADMENVKHWVHQPRRASIPAATAEDTALLRQLGMQGNAASYTPPDSPRSPDRRNQRVFSYPGRPASAASRPSSAFQSRPTSASYGGGSNSPSRPSSALRLSSRPSSSRPHTASSSRPTTASRVKVKFTEDQWMESTEYLKNATHVNRQSSATNRQRAKDMRHGTKKHLRAKESEVGNKFVKRIGAITGEVSKERKCLNALQTEYDLISKAVHDFAETVRGQLTWPLEVNGHCMKLREKRQGIDRVSDAAEAELGVEKVMLLDLEDSLAKQGQRARAHVRLLVDALDLVNADLKRKRTAEHVDSSMAKLSKERKGALTWSPGDIKARPKSAVETKTWSKHNKDLLAASLVLCEESKVIRNELSNATAGAGAAIKKQEIVASEALRGRLKQLVEARKVDSRLATTLDYEIDSAKRERRSLRRAIEEQQNTLKRTSTRLGTRTTRPGLEKTRDTVHVALVEEAAEIDQAVIALLTEYDETITTITALAKNMAMLKHDEKIKKNSIKIEEQCLEKRSYFARMQFEAMSAKVREKEEGNSKGWEGTGIGAIDKKTTSTVAGGKAPRPKTAPAGSSRSSSRSHNSSRPGSSKARV